MLNLFSCCRDGEGEGFSGGKKDLFVDVDVDDDTSLPDLDACTSTTTSSSSSGPNSPDTDGIFAFADEERGVTVAIFNFLMILFGLSQMHVSSGRKAITAG